MKELNFDVNFLNNGCKLDCNIRMLRLCLHMYDKTVKVLDFQKNWTYPHLAKDCLLSKHAITETMCSLSTRSLLLGNPTCFYRKVGNKCTNYILYLSQI